jgi:hypothetical protein
VVATEEKSDMKLEREARLCFGVRGVLAFAFWLEGWNGGFSKE